MFGSMSVIILELLRSSMEPFDIYIHICNILFFHTLHTSNHVRSMKACQKRQHYSELAVGFVAISDCVDDRMSCHEYHGCTISVDVLFYLFAFCALSCQQSGLILPKTGDTGELTTLDIYDVASMDVAAL